MLEPTLVFVDGIQCVQFPDGRTFPIIAGGADPEPAKDDPDPKDDPDDPDDPDDENDPDNEVDEEELDDKAKKFLAKERAKHAAEMSKARKARKAARDAERKANAELRKAKAGKPSTDEEALEAAKQAAREEAQQEATTKSNARILRSEIKAAAAGKVVDPSIIPGLLDLDQFEVDEDGEVDEDAIASAIDELLEKKPYLKAEPKGKGSADGGARGSSKTKKPGMNEALRALATGKG